MADRDGIQFDLIKLVSAELSLEKKLFPADAVVRQKERLFRVFEVALARAEALTA